MVAIKETSKAFFFIEIFIYIYKNTFLKGSKILNSKWNFKRQIIKIGDGSVEKSSVWFDSPLAVSWCYLTSSVITRKVFPVTLERSPSSSWDLRSSDYEAATWQRNERISSGWASEWWNDLQRILSSRSGLEFSLVQLQTPRCEVEIIINSSLLPHLHSYLHVYLFLPNVVFQVWGIRETGSKNSFPKKKNPGKVCG